MLRRKIATRLYLVTMRFESMGWLKVRRALLHWMGAQLGADVKISPHVFIEGAENLRIGSNVTLNRGCFVSAIGGLTIGDYVSTGHAVTILTTEHGHDGIIQQQPIRFKQTSIGSNCWIGARVCIRAGVSVAEGTIIGLGSVVTRSVEESYCTIAGNPARLIRRRLA